MNELLFIISSITFIYLRFLALYFTKNLIALNLGKEGNPFMKDAVSGSLTGNIAFILNMAITIIVFYFLLVFFEPTTAHWFVLFFIFFICWIDFQHDFEWWHARHELKEKKVQILNQKD